MESVNNPPIRLGIQIGMDIGQRVDPTAIVVAEKQLRGYTVRPFDDWQVIADARQKPKGGEIHYVIRFIQRLPLGTSYKVVFERLAEIHHALPQKDILACRLDATGAGQPVIDLVRESGIRVTAVYFTGGEHTTETGDELHLVKNHMVSHLQVLIQNHRILLDPNNMEAQAMVEELLNYQIIVTESANLKTGVFKIGAHDDLATGLGLATWEGEHRTIKFGYAPDGLSEL